MVENGEYYLYLAENDKMLSSYFLEHDLKLHTWSEMQISGEIWDPKKSYCGQFSCGASKFSAYCQKSGAWFAPEEN